jgi:hypothetical protein
MFKANGRLKIMQERKKKAGGKNTVDRTFLKGQSVDLFRAAIKSQATRDPYERRLQVRTDSVIRRAISIAFLVLLMCIAASAIIR